MLKAGIKRAKKEIRSLKYKQKAYELNKKRFVPGILVSLRKDSKFKITKQNIHSMLYTEPKGDFSKEAVGIEYSFVEKTSRNWEPTITVDDQRMCFEVKDIFYEEKEMEVNLKLEGVIHLMSCKSFNILDRPKRRKLA